MRNSLQHLERSNAELRKAIEENGPDPDFRQAINENIVVIAKRRARLEALEVCCAGSERAWVTGWGAGWRARRGRLTRRSHPPLAFLSPVTNAHA